MLLKLIDLLFLNQLKNISRFQSPAIVTYLSNLSNELEGQTNKLVFLPRGKYERLPS